MKCRIRVGERDVCTRTIGYGMKSDLAVPDPQALTLREEWNGRSSLKEMTIFSRKRLGYRLPLPCCGLLATIFLESWSSSIAAANMTAWATVSGMAEMIG